MKESERSESYLETEPRKSIDEAASLYAEEGQFRQFLRQQRASRLNRIVTCCYPATSDYLAHDQRQFVTDGGVDNLHKGSRIAKVYYWLDPETGAALAHTNAYDDEANPYFETIEEAERFLEQRAETADRLERYETMSLYEAKTRKIRDAKDVLTEQAAFDDFLPAKKG